MGKLLEWSLIAIIAVIFLVVLSLLFMGEGGPTCEEQGGHKVQNGVLPQSAGKVTVMIPQYKCVIPGDKSE